ncbi:YhgE/Pip domain-containing protein [Bacillus cytotoxicus]|uniref:YhgE/Pip domain-containing protein n=1 Tax=Bacillus cytotoxicus TaxID=580165 RepID=A0ACC6A5P3_9BACI|nr:YhgE/Pip domain-containing protein [Bacillus cytotoxicus]
MRGWKLLGKEFATIIKSKKILIPIIAVLFIPVLYAGMFLWAFWDPYKQLDDLPVAVVNLDEGVVYNGKPIEAGKELVKNLKEKDGFKWEFVSEKTAKKGMDDRKYYMTVRIPSDFSKNTTTLLDANPKKSKLEYIPNESLNFLSSQIGGSAIEKIKSEVSASVTKTYAETMFDSLKDVSKGFADGSEGAGKLRDGTGELKDGSGKVTDGLHTLQGKSGEMKNGVGKLLDGSGQLLDASGKITAGLNVLNSKTSGMPAGIGKLQDGSGQITNVLNLLSGKTGEMKIGIGKLLDGSDKVTGGLNLLVNKSGEMQHGIGELSSGSVKLAEGTNEISDGLGGLQKGQERLAKEGVQPIQKGLNELSGKLQASADGITKMENQISQSATESAKKLDDGAKQFTTGVSNWQATASGLKDGAKKVDESAQNVVNDLGQLEEEINNLPEEQKQKLQNTIQKLKSDTVATVGSTKQVAQGAQKLAEASDGLKQGATDFTNGVKTSVNNSQSQLKTGMDHLIVVQKQFVKGATELANGQQIFMNNFQTFGEKLGEAKNGAAGLAGGASKLNGGLGQLADGSVQLISGVNKLANGSGQVTGGLGVLSEGSGQMAGVIGQLANGSGQITGGLGVLSEGSGQMVGAIGLLADGSNKVTTGLGTLNGGLGKMSDGSGQLIDGVNQLADGSGKVTTGLGEANNGSKELATKLGEGAEKTSETKGDEKKYDMFASPVNVKTEKMAEVPNYGTGFTPYFLSLGLFVGALLLSIVFPLRETVGVPKSGFSWFISKFGVLFAVGVVQALVADAVLLLWLGVEVQSVPYFILFSIITSLSFIALVQFLVTTFGDAGRFVAILTLILQLTTSAGTFPLELIPKGLQVFNAWFPMTYSVSGLKAVVSSGDFGFMWQNAGVLMIFIVLLSLGTIGTLTWMHKRQYGRSTETE